MPLNINRYSRQLLLPQFSRKTQEQLARTRILLVGAGGIGSIALPMLAGAGIGYITVVDDDCVDESNLHRQPLYTTADIGQPKALLAAARARAINPECTVIARQQRFNQATAVDLVHHTLLVDGSDNWQTRITCNQAAIAHHKPLFSAAAQQWQVQVATWTAGINPASACYQCLYDILDGTALNERACDASGILAPVVGLAASWLTLEVLRYAAGMPCLLESKVLTCNALTGQQQLYSVPKNTTCRTCATCS